MGAWGITMRESDSGLDLLALVEKKCLKPIDFKYFNVDVILDFLKNHIIEQIKKANSGCAEDMMAHYIEANFTSDYNDAVLLVSECFADYLHKGAFIAKDYETKTEMKITEFIFTDSVLDELLEELHKMLEPTHDMYTTLFEDDTRKEWVSVK